MAISFGSMPSNAWQGLSTDAKPTDNRVSFNQIFFETDTQRAYVWSGTAWNLWPPIQNVSQPAGARQPSSAINSRLDVTLFSGVQHTLTGIAAINLSGRSIGVAGAIGDTMIAAVMILRNAGPATLTLTGFSQNESGTNKTIVLTGSTTADTYYNFAEMINYAAAAQVTASVADTCIVWHGVP